MKVKIQKLLKEEHQLKLEMLIIALENNVDNEISSENQSEIIEKISHREKERYINNPELRIQKSEENIGLASLPDIKGSGKKTKRRRNKRRLTKRRKTKRSKSNRIM